MAFQPLNLGVSSNDPTGLGVRANFAKIQANFDSISSRTPFYCDTIADLRSIATNATNRYARVFGLTALDDGSGGDYRWQTGAAPADDGQSIIRPTDYAGTGYWKKL